MYTYIYINIADEGLDQVQAQILSASQGAALESRGAPDDGPTLSGQARSLSSRQARNLSSERTLPLPVKTHLSKFRYQNFIC